MTNDSTARRRVVAVVAAGIFASSLANTQILALPLRTLLRDRLGLDATGMASFFGLALAPWYAKPAVGWLSDRLPLAGERRRPYLVLGGALAVAAWIVAGAVAGASRISFGALLGACTVANLGAVLVSTVSGGLLVEAGQRFDMVRTLARARTFVSYAAVVCAGPLAGRLAEHGLGPTAAVAAGLMACLAAIAWRGLRQHEEDAATADVPREKAGASLRRLFAGRGLWLVAAFVFLIQLAPGFQSPLFFFQTQRLGFSPSFIGVLSGVGSAAAMLVALGYDVLLKRLSLAGRLRVAVLASAVGALLYLAYLSRGAALAIDAMGGAVSSLCLIALFELVARATPRGLEGLGYGLFLSLYTVAMQLSDVLGSALYDHWHLGFRELVLVNAGTTLLVLVLVPMLPRELLAEANRVGDGRGGPPKG